jgi:hypothetical protein
MPPKKSIPKSDSNMELMINETVNVVKTRKPRTKKTSEPEKIDELNKSKKINESEEKIEEIKKTRAKKTDDEPKKIKNKKITQIEEPLSKTDNNIEYNALKIEWAILCEKIKEANKEKELLETQKNQLLNKLWKLGETSYPKSDIYETSDKIKPIQSKILSIQTKILDHDSSDNSKSDESSIDSDSECDKIKKPKIITKKIVKSDSDTSDSESN